MYKINFNHLHYFLTIAKEGTIVKASKKLNITQPALSHQLRLLEEDLGQKLFDRKGKRLVINEHGLQVKEYAQRIFRNAEEMIKTISTKQVDIYNIVKIGVLPAIPKKFIYEHFKNLIYSQNNIVEVRVLEHESLIKELHSEKIDIAISDTSFTGRSHKLSTKKIHTEKIICVTGKKSNKKEVFPDIINKKRIITLTEDSFAFSLVDRYLESKKLLPVTVSSFSDSDFIANVVEKKSQFIAFLPETAVREKLKEKKLIKVGSPENLNYSIWMVTRKANKSNSLYKLIYGKD